MAILTLSGRAALARAIAEQPLHLAWGSGDPAWDTAREPEPVNATALVNEIGRRTVTQVQYVLPDAAGEIVIPTGRFRISAAPTPHLFVRFTFDFSDAPAAIIREIGIFVGTQTKPGLPAGQRYFAPSDIAAPGTLLSLERLTRFERNPSVRPTFETVISI